MTAKTRQEVALAYGLNSFGNHLEFHGPSQRNYGFRNGSACGVHQHVPDERVIDLQLIHGQSLQVGQRRITRAEVVQGESQAMRFEDLHFREDFHEIIHQYGFRNFQYEAIWIGLRAIKCSQ